MPVMTAGVHGVIVYRSKAFPIGKMLRIVRFLHIVGIHVKAQPHHRPGLLETQCPHNAGQPAPHGRHKGWICALLDGTRLRRF